MRADIPKRRVFFCTRNRVKINLYSFCCKDRLPISKKCTGFLKKLLTFSYCVTMIPTNTSTVQHKPMT
mgnify:FL=1